MNENINLVEILKNCPINTELYSPLYGVVKFKGINKIARIYNINVEANINGRNEFAFFTEKGLFYDFTDGECLLFPSKDQRDWSKFIIS